MRSVIRLLIAVVLAVLAGVSHPAEAREFPGRVAHVHDYTYDASLHVVQGGSAKSERGPPTSNYTSTTTSDAVACWSHGGSARPVGAAPLAKTTYDDPARFVSVAQATTTTGSRVVLLGGDLVSLARLKVAAETAASFGTESGQAVFWSGLGRDGASQAAEYAAKTGGTTLEQTAGAAGLPAYDSANAASVAAWRSASGAFARGASGDVRVLLGNVRAGSIRNTVELPAL
jgi:hypothetical protein